MIALRGHDGCETSDETGPDEPVWLTAAMLLLKHAPQAERHDGAHGILDENVVRFALARPRHRWSLDPEPDLTDLAAALLVGFARSQSFKDGNKRTGLAAALVFLRLSGYVLRRRARTIEPVEALLHR